MRNTITHDYYRFDFRDTVDREEEKEMTYSAETNKFVFLAAQNWSLI